MRQKLEHLTIPSSQRFVDGIYLLNFTSTKNINVKNKGTIVTQNVKLPENKLLEESRLQHNLSMLHRAKSPLQKTMIEPQQGNQNIERHRYTEIRDK